MIHNISLAECLEAVSPPAKVLNIGVCDDTVFVRICDVQQDHQREVHRDIADISVSLPALIEALALLATDGEREHLRPDDSDGRTKETRIAGRRLTVSPVAPYSAVAALTDHYRHTPAPKPTPGAGNVRAGECGTSKPAAPREAPGELSQVISGGSGI